MFDQPRQNTRSTGSGSASRFSAPDQILSLDELVPPESLPEDDPLVVDEDRLAYLLRREGKEEITELEAADLAYLQEQLEHPDAVLCSFQPVFPGAKVRRDIVHYCFKGPFRKLEGRDVAGQMMSEEVVKKSAPSTRYKDGRRQRYCPLVVMSPPADHVFFGDGDIKTWRHEQEARQLLSDLREYSNCPVFVRASGGIGDALSEMAREISSLTRLLLEIAKTAPLPVRGRYYNPSEVSLLEARLSQLRVEYADLEVEEADGALGRWGRPAHLKLHILVVGMPPHIQALWKTYIKSKGWNRWCDVRDKSPGRIPIGPSYYSGEPVSRDVTVKAVDPVTGEERERTQTWSHRPIDNSLIEKFHFDYEGFAREGKRYAENPVLMENAGPPPDVSDRVLALVTGGMVTSERAGLSLILLERRQQELDEEVRYVSDLYVDVSPKGRRALDQRLDRLRADLRRVEAEIQEVRSTSRMILPAPRTATSITEEPAVQGWVPAPGRTRASRRRMARLEEKLAAIGPGSKSNSEVALSAMHYTMAAFADDPERATAWTMANRRRFECLRRYEVKQRSKPTPISEKEALRRIRNHADAVLKSRKTHPRRRKLKASIVDYEIYWLTEVGGLRGKDIALWVKARRRPHADEPYAPGHRGWARKAGLSRMAANRRINRLIDQGYVKLVSFPNRTRGIPWGYEAVLPEEGQEWVRKAWEAKLLSDEKQSQDENKEMGQTQGLSSPIPSQLPPLGALASRLLSNRVSAHPFRGPPGLPHSTLRMLLRSVARGELRPDEAIEFADGYRSEELDRELARQKALDLAEHERWMDEVRFAKRRQAWLERRLQERLAEEGEAYEQSMAMEGGDDEGNFEPLAA